MRIRIVTEGASLRWTRPLGFTRKPLKGWEGSRSVRTTSGMYEF
jgi:hypothetical protein